MFDPATPVLFDFRTPQAGDSRFVYILPDDPYRVLVELTAFVPRQARPPSLVERRTALAEYLTASYTAATTTSVAPSRQCWHYAPIRPGAAPGGS